LADLVDGIQSSENDHSLQREACHGPRDWREAGCRPSAISSDQWRDFREFITYVLGETRSPVNNAWGRRAMTDEQKGFFKQRTKQALEEKPHLKPLLNKLLSLGGKAVVLWNGSNGPNGVAHLLADGKIFSNRDVKIVAGEPSRCHDNAFALWESKPKRYMVVTGYGLSKHGIWRPHSWCIDRKTGKIIETTERRTKYFGVEFSKAEFEDAQEVIKQSQKSASQKPRKKAKGRTK
jgi:hypothetical protein